VIAVIENTAELDRFSEILKEEAMKLMGLAGGVLDLKQLGMYEHLMNRVKTRFRAWQMEQTGFEASGAAAEYRTEAVVESFRRRTLEDR